jgi:hypothetical protein
MKQAPSADRMHSGERVKEARLSAHPVDLTAPTQADDGFLLCGRRVITDAA